MLSAIFLFQIACTPKPVQEEQAVAEEVKQEETIEYDDLTDLEIWERRQAAKMDTPEYNLEVLGFSQEAASLISDEFRDDPSGYREKVLQAQADAQAADEMVAQWIEEHSLESGHSDYRNKLKEVQHQAALIKHQYYLLLGGIWGSSVTDDIEQKLVSLGLLAKGVYPHALMGVLEDGRERFWFVAHNSNSVCLYRVDTKRGDLLGERCTFGSKNSGSLWNIQENFENIKSNLENKAQSNLSNS